MLPAWLFVSSPNLSVSWRGGCRGPDVPKLLFALLGPGARRSGRSGGASGRFGEAGPIYLRTAGARLSPGSASSRRLGHILVASTSLATLSRSLPPRDSQEAVASRASKDLPSLHRAKAHRNILRAKATTATARPRR